MLEVYDNALRDQFFAGMEPEAVALISSPDVLNPETCSAFIRFLENFWRAEGQGAVLFHAETALMMMKQ